MGNFKSVRCNKEGSAFPSKRRNTAFYTADPF